MQNNREEKAQENTAASNGKRERSVLLTVCPFILGTEMAERFTYYGMRLNIINYLKLLGTSSSTGASISSVISGCSYLTPLLGGWIADAHWGRYKTILRFAVVFVIGTFILSGSAFLPGIRVEDGERANAAQWMLFVVALFLMALGTGGIKSNASAFGADQFSNMSEQDQREKKSFFNWFFFFINIGGILATAVAIPIQDRGMWGLSFAIIGGTMLFFTFLFALAQPLYKMKPSYESPLARFFGITYRAIQNRKKEAPYTIVSSNEEQTSHATARQARSSDAHWLDVAVGSGGGFTRADVDEAKMVYKLVPIFATTILVKIFAYNFDSLLVLQGNQMERDAKVFGRNATMPSASMVFFNTVACLVFVVMYDRVIVPSLNRFFNFTPTMLQRVGAGFFIGTLSLANAFFVERMRLQKYHDGAVHSDVVDGEEVEVVELSIFWIAPSYSLTGISEVLALAGLIEFYYSQAPESMKSILSAMFLVALGISGYLFSLLLYVIDAISSTAGKQWVSDNLNDGHLDWMYCLLLVMLIMASCLFLYVAHGYQYEMVQQHPSTEIHLVSLENTAQNGDSHDDAPPL